MASSQVLHFTDDTFETEVIQSDVPVLVDFWAEWCGPCQRLGPTIDALAEQYAGKVKVGKVNIDQNQGVAGNLGIASIPTVLIFQGGQPVQRLVGLRGKSDYEEILDGIIA